MNRRVALAGIEFDALTENETVAAAIAGLEQGRGGWIMPVNLDVLRLASRSPTTRELVEDGVNGTLVTPGRTDALAAALARQLADPEGRRRMGAAGRERVAAEFEVGECSRQVAELMRSVVTE